MESYVSPQRSPLGGFLYRNIAGVAVFAGGVDIP